MVFEDFNYIKESKNVYFNTADKNSYILYMRQLGKKHRLTEKERLALIKDVQENNSNAENALNKLIADLQGICYLLAKKYCNNNYLMDYISEANISVIKSIKTYNLDNPEASFFAYVINGIRLNGNYVNTKLVHAFNKTHTKRIKTFMDKYYQENGYYPTFDIIKEEFPNITKCELDTIEHFDKTYISLDSYKQEFDNDYMRDRLENEINTKCCENEELNYNEQDEKEYLLSKINDYFQIMIDKYENKKHENKVVTIPKIYKEKYIIEHTFGLNGCDIQTTKEIANVVKLHPEYVNKLRTDCINKMKLFFNKNDAKLFCQEEKK